MIASRVIDILKLGISAHEQGQVKLAEKYYKEILLSYPHHPDANHNFGILLAQHGLQIEALAHFNLAINQDPNIQQFWLSYIDTAILANKLENAHNYYFFARLNGLDGPSFEQRKRKLYKISTKKALKEPEVPKEIFSELITLLNKGFFSEILTKIEGFIQNP